MTIGKVLVVRHGPVSTAYSIFTISGNKSRPIEVSASSAWTKRASNFRKEILETWPVGTVPEPEKTTFRTNKEMEPYLKEPGSKGWKSIYCLPRIGPY